MESSMDVNTLRHMVCLNKQKFENPCHSTIMYDDPAVLHRKEKLKRKRKRRNA